MLIWVASRTTSEGRARYFNWGHLSNKFKNTWINFKYVIYNNKRHIKILQNFKCTSVVHGRMIMNDEDKLENIMWFYTSAGKKKTFLWSVILEISNLWVKYVWNTYKYCHCYINFKIVVGFLLLVLYNFLAVFIQLCDLRVIFSLTLWSTSDLHNLVITEF